MRRILFSLTLAAFALTLAAVPGRAAESKPAAVKSSRHATPTKSKTIKASKPRKAGARKRPAAVHVGAPVASFGQLAGLHNERDALGLKSSAALVIDQDTNEVLFSKNEQAVLPIASLTKLMTGLVLVEAQLPMDEMITIAQDDVDTEKGSSSRLTVGTALSRAELMRLALMSSENRAAHALARSYPGGLAQFVGLMNSKAQLIGMNDTRYVEPTGLSARNQSSARDLAKLVNVAYKEPLLRELTTTPDYEVAVGRRRLQYNNTNRLVKNPAWDIGLQKTGYIAEAGHGLVMQTRVAGRKLIMVFLDSVGKLTRLADAQRVKHWVESVPLSAATLPLANSLRL